VYVVTGYENLSFCEDQYFFSVEIDDPPLLTTTANGIPGPAWITVCAYEPVQLNVIPNPGGTYLYNWWPDPELDDGSLQNPIATPSHTTWFYVSVSTLSGCAVAVDSILVNVVGGDVMIHDAETEKDALCLGDSSQLTLDVQQIIAEDALDVATGAMWNSVTGGVINNICGSVSGDALYFDGAGTRIAETNDFDVSLGGTVRFALKIATGLAPCEDADAGDNVVLEFSTNSGASWNPTPVGLYFEYAYPTFTTIDAVIPPAAMTASTRFRWRQLGAFAPGQDNWMLDNVAIAIKDITSLTFSWTPAATLSSGTVQNPMAYPVASGWYYITTTDLISLCTYEDSVYIDVGAPFSIDVTPDTAICDVAGIQLWATPSSGTGHTWDWTPTATLSAGFIEDPIATPSSTTEYFVTVTTSQGCTATDSVTITVNSLLGLNVTASDVDLCAGENSQLNAVVVGGGPGLVYSWTPSSWLDNDTIANPLATPLAPVTYIATVTDPSGCSLVDSVFIDVSTLYQVTATEDTVVCVATGLVLDVQHNVPSPFTITWTPGAPYLTGSSTANPVVQFDSTMQYIVQVQDNIGCSGFDTTNITVAFSSLSIFADSSLCAGDSALIDAGFPWATHDWTPGGETTQTIWVNAAGDYTVTMTDSTGCQVVFTTTITVDPLPVVALGADTSLCVGQNWVLNAGNPGSNYVWSTGQFSQQINVTTDDDYWVQVTDGNDCTNSDTIDVVFDPLPVIDLHDTAVCVSETVILNAENAGSWYAWSPGGQTTQTIAVNVNSGTYSVVVTTPTWCVDSADADITFVDFPVVDLGPDTALCDGEQITLDAQNAGETFLWHNGATSQTVTLFDDAMAWVDVYNGYCTTRDSVDVVFNPLPIEFLPPAITTCLDYPPHYAVLDAGNPECTFLWNNGQITEVILADEYGQYNVHITTPLNCSIDDSVLVQEYCQSAIYLPNTFTPDGDGVNDLFFPNGTNVSTAELMIFDRWGELVHSGKDGDAWWDGKVNGNPVQDGVYIWKVKYRFYENTEHSVQSPEYEEVGHVTLLR
jgi:gliding motility-associated-like protein